MPLAITKKIMKIANKYCNVIAVHPRTLQQGYSGNPDINFAKQVKKLTKLPIIYSGNIKNKQEADKILREFNFVMIARAAIGNPNIFYELIKKEKYKKINFLDYLKLARKYKLSFSQIKFQAMNFIHSFPGAAEARLKISKAKNTDDILEILSN